MTEKCILNLFIRFDDTVKTCEVLDKFSESIDKSNVNNIPKNQIFEALKKELQSLVANRSKH